MAAHPAVGIHPTQAGTRILALAADTSLVLGTIWVDIAFWTAVGWRADHFWQARAFTFSVDFIGRVGVRPAGVRLAGVIGNDWFNGWKKNYKIILIFLKVFLLMHCEFIKKHEKTLIMDQKETLTKRISSVKCILYRVSKKKIY